jgi:hypothetical protein
MPLPEFVKSGCLVVVAVSKKGTAEVCNRTTAFARRLNGHSALAVAGVLGPAMWVIGDLTSGFATSHYSLIRNSISSLALTNIGWLATIGFLALGLFVEVFAAGLLFNIKGRRFFYFGVAIFVILGFAILLIGAFRTDPVGAARTLEGKIHGMTARTAFSIFPLALLGLIPSIKHDPNWQRFYRYTLVTIILAVLLLVINKIFQEGSGWFGLAERLLVWNMIIWVEVGGINMFFLSLKREPKTPFFTNVNTSAN